MEEEDFVDQRTSFCIQCIYKMSTREFVDKAPPPPPSPDWHKLCMACGDKEAWITRPPLDQYPLGGMLTFINLWKECLRAREEYRQLRAEYDSNLESKDWGDERRYWEADAPSDTLMKRDLTLCYLGEILAKARENMAKIATNLIIWESLSRQAGDIAEEIEEWIAAKRATYM